jgi:hypothetical protein
LATVRARYADFGTFGIGCQTCAEIVIADARTAQDGTRAASYTALTSFLSTAPGEMKWHQFGKASCPPSRRSFTKISA